MSFLDDIIGAFAPGMALDRVRARMALDKLREYEAARPGNRRVESWRRRDAGPQGEVARGASDVRRLVRDLLRNNGYATRAHRKLVSATISTGITGAVLDAKGRPASAALRDTWNRYVDEADWCGEHDLYGLQMLIARAVYSDGEALLRRYRTSFDANTRTPPFRWQVLEVDHIDAGKFDLVRGAADNGFIDRGIEYDARGRKVALWLYPDHPQNLTPYLRSRFESERVPIGEVVQIYDTLRPGQDRGVSIFSPAIMPLSDLADYLTKEAMRKSIEAALAVFITTPENPDQGGLTLGAGAGSDAASTDGAGNTLSRLMPGMITRLKPGEAVDPGPVAPVGDMSPFVQQMGFLAAAGVGVMYEHMTGDFRNVNYSSFRVGSFDFGQFIEQQQWLVFGQRMCRPMAQGFTEGVAALGISGAAGVNLRWTPPNPVVSPDPEKDARADKLQVEMLVKAPSEISGARGWQHGEMLERIAADMLAADAALPPGSRSTADPRNPKAGTAPAPAPNQENPPNA
ncbi:phage portal protein [Sandarakinorhabdus sp.]|uniref:phage portal protein n=1 Tax=Sandarakinorhabdus sp. TaxID=1916663 RepID=UPI00286E8351|nr:phage portal protein [Sandarakinorhabdus sp.]